MFSIFSNNTWSYSLGVDSKIDFCIWALQQDGLHIPPFEYHPDGDGSLRAAGLNSTGWLQWLYAIVDQCNQFDAAMRADRASLQAWQKNMDKKTLLQALQASQEKNLQRVRGLPRVDPPGLWSGSLSVRERLQELWDQYNLSIAPLRQQREMEL